MRPYVILSLLLAGAATAAAEPATEWTFARCVEYASSHNIGLRQSRLATERAGYQLEAAQGQWQPTLGLSTTQGVTNNPFHQSGQPSTAYSSSYGVQSQWVLYNGGERDNTIKRARLEIGGTELTTLAARRSLEMQILQLYLNILYAREAIVINTEAADVSQAQAERAKQLMEAGRLSRVDYAQLAAQAEQDRYSVVSATASYNTERMNLKRLLQLGLTEEFSIAPADWSREQVLALPRPMEQCYSEALAIDPSLQATDIAISQADLDVEIAKASGRPTVSLNAGVSTGYNAPGSPFWQQMKWAFNENLGATLTVPIFDQRKTRTAVAQARVDKIDAELSRESIANDLAQSVETWYIDLASAQSRYTASLAQVESAELSDELVNEQFKLGLVNTVELLTAHNTLTQARRELLQAKYMAMLSHKMIEYLATASTSVP